jgi:hypothetical protein
MAFCSGLFIQVEGSEIWASAPNRYGENLQAYELGFPGAAEKWRAEK